MDNNLTLNMPLTLEVPGTRNTDTVRPSREASKVSDAVRNMRIAFWLNFVFACIEFAGGLLTNSVTILSDAVHDLGDSIVIGLSLVLEKKSHQGRTAKFTYGQRRFSILAAFCTSLVLIAGSVFIVYEAIHRLIRIEEVNSGGVIGLAVLGILFNGIAVLRLKKDSRESLNHKGIMLHLLEDVLGWVAVLVGAVIMYFTSWFWIDPILSLLVAALILWNAVKNIRSSLSIFLQTVPPGFEEQKIVDELLTALPILKEVSELHCWTLDGTEHVLTLKVLLHAQSRVDSLETIIFQINTIVRRHGKYHTTIQIRES